MKKAGIFAELITNKGRVLIKLEYKRAPIAVANFICLAEGKIENDIIEIGEKFYDGLNIYFADNNLIQVGCPNGNGSSHPGYNIPLEIHSELTFSKSGLLGMCFEYNNPGYCHGTQFFITKEPIPTNTSSTIFGEVIDGEEILPTIFQGDTLQAVNIIINGQKAKNFNAIQIFEERYEDIEDEMDEINEDEKEDTLEEMIERLKIFLNTSKNGFKPWHLIFIFLFWFSFKGCFTSIEGTYYTSTTKVSQLKLKAKWYISLSLYKDGTVSVKTESCMDYTGKDCNVLTTSKESTGKWVKLKGKSISITGLINHNEYNGSWKKYNRDFWETRNECFEKINDSYPFAEGFCK